MTWQVLDLTTKPDAPAGNLPNFDTGQAIQTIYQSSPAGNAPIISGGGAMSTPTIANQAQGFYGQWNAPTRPTGIGIEWMWTENKPAGDNNGPVAATLGGPLTLSNGTLQLPMINGQYAVACHAGCSMVRWHIDNGPPGFWGFATPLQGPFTPSLVPNIAYRMALVYTAADTVKMYLPNGAVTPTVQNPAFNSLMTTWAFFEAALMKGTTESNVKILRVWAETTQWNPVWPPPADPPPGQQPVVKWEPFCRNHGAVDALYDTEAAATDAAKAHVTANPGHVITVGPTVR